MENEDDLIGSFFSELNNLEVPVEAPTVEPAIVEEPPAPFVPQVISRAPEISKGPVYVYEFDQEEANASASSSSSSSSSSYPAASAPTSASTNSYASYQPTSSFSTTYTSTTTSSAAVNPPVAPRQDKVFARTAAGETWVDDSLNEWPDNDFRIFVGDLAKEVNTEHLVKQFQTYKSFAKAKVIRTKYDSKARGFGFVSFLDPMDCAKAIREQNGKYLCSRPMKITKSSWNERNLKEVKKKETKKRKIQESLGLA